MAIMDIVDKNDQVIGSAKRSDIKNSDIFRCVCIILINDEGRILLQLRSQTTSHHPLHWDISVGGCVDSGETYIEAARREMREELGIVTDIEFIDKYLFEAEDKKRYFSTLFRAHYSGTFKIDPKEVAKVHSFSKEDIIRMIKDKEKFSPECLFVLKKYILSTNP